jgi:hypothetical protein
MQFTFMLSDEHNSTKVLSLNGVINIAFEEELAQASVGLSDFASNHANLHALCRFGCA